jgi:site-specific DNA-methyltransferase (adenine-specific)
MKLIKGDCLEEMKNIDDNSIDLLFCDLPYGQTRCKWDSLIDLNLFWKEVNRICKDRTPMFFTCSTKFGVSLINSNPKNFRYDLVWVKSVSCGFLSAKKMPLKKHEMIYVFYRKLPLYDLSSHTHKFIDCDCDIRTDKGCSSLYGNETNKLMYKDDNGKIRNNEPRYNPPLPNTILEIKSEKGKHATQKPTELIKWILKYYSKEGDVVLDPTMGSGSTGVACKDLNRDFIGIELDNEIFKIAQERLSDE